MFNANWKLMNSHVMDFHISLFIYIIYIIRNKNLKNQNIMILKVLFEIINKIFIAVRKPIQKYNQQKLNYKLAHQLNR